MTSPFGDSPLFVNRLSIADSGSFSPRRKKEQRALIPFSRRNSFSEGGAWVKCKTQPEALFAGDDSQKYIPIFEKGRVVLLDKEDLKRQSFSIYQRISRQRAKSLPKPEEKSPRFTALDYLDLAAPPNLKSAIEASLYGLKSFKTPEFIEKIQQCFQTKALPQTLPIKALFSQEEGEIPLVISAGANRVLLLTGEHVGRGGTLFVKKGYLLIRNKFGSIQREEVACRFILNEHPNFEIEQNSFLKYQTVPGVVPSLGEFQIEVDEDKIYTGFLQKYCKNKTLLEYFQGLKNDLSLKERLPAIFLEILQGVYQIHWRGDVHRDLKLENIYLDNSTVYIGDLGSLCPEGSKQGLEGTKEYWPPEVHSCKQKRNVCPTQKQDVWSLGCVFYMLCYREGPPFFSQPEQLANLVSNSYFKKSKDFFKEPSDKRSFEHLIWSMLRTDPKKRISIKEALNKVEQLQKTPEKIWNMQELLISL